MKRIPPEVIVFVVIAVMLISLTLTVDVPSQSSSLTNSGQAPELAGVSGWINSEPLNIGNLKGKVVMIDFWTYTCINCIRTIPYLKEWHQRYADDGLVIIGVHTPEFEFEKDPNNVKNAVEKYGILYPVVQDNDYETWRAYKNQYWPRKYLIDKEGNIRYDHIGEGGYEETEKIIQELLGIKENTSSVESADYSQIGTPELYLGYNFARVPLGNWEGFSKESIVDYDPVEVTQANTVYLRGKWINRADKVVSVSNSSVFLIYRAKNVNIVAGGNSTAEIFISGFKVAEGMNGNDVVNGSLLIDSQRLYNIVSTPSYGLYLLEIRAQPGFELYTFTFG